MNKERRKMISGAVDDLQKARSLMEDALQLIELGRSALEGARDEEQEYFDNMPENMQGGDRGSMAEEAVSNLDDAESTSQEAIDALDGVIDQLDGMSDALRDACSRLEDAESSAADAVA